MDDTLIHETSGLLLLVRSTTLFNSLAKVLVTAQMAREHSVIFDTFQRHSLVHIAPD